MTVCVCSVLREVMQIRTSIRIKRETHTVSGKCKETREELDSGASHSFSLLFSLSLRLKPSFSFSFAFRSQSLVPFSFSNASICVFVWTNFKPSERQLRFSSSFYFVYFEHGEEKKSSNLQCSVRSTRIHYYTMHLLLSILALAFVIQYEEKSLDLECVIESKERWRRESLSLT